MDSQPSGTRVTVKHSRPNPLFQEWLEELYEEATSKNSPLVHKLHEALESLSKYPLPLQTGVECRVLKGFDKRLCIFLDRRLEAYNTKENVNAENSSSPRSDSTNEFARKRCRKHINTTNSQENLDPDSIVPENMDPETIATENGNGPKKPRIRKEYRPAFRSGGYAILMALLDNLKENEVNPVMKKEEIMEKAQKYSEESFVRPKPNSFYTAWSNMSRLLTKGLVTKVPAKKAQFALTDEGVAVAIEIFEETKNRPTLNEIIFNDNATSQNAENQHGNGDSQPVSMISSASTSSTLSIGIPTSSQSSLNSQEIIELPAGTFDILLLIDKMETGGASKKNDPTIAQFNKYPDLKHEYRSLKVGDFTWIARHREQKDWELVLPYVVERKRMDDLGKSIKDGRFHEQKFRLRKCGLKNVIYLAENYGSNKHVGLPLTTLSQALTNTRIHDGFKVHVTDSHTNSVRFLAMMTKRLTIEYKDQNLVGRNMEPQGENLMTFKFFNKSSSKRKPLTVTETFTKLLLTLRGVSLEKALAITELYKTPNSLMRTYSSFECDGSTPGEVILAKLKYSNSSANVGNSVSKSLYQFFTWKQE